MYATNFTSQKLRGFVVDKSSARPLPNVIVVLMAQRDQQISTPIGMLVSDVAGYVSFDLNDLPDSTIQRFERLWLYAMGDEMARIDDVRPYILVGMRPSAGTHFLLSADAKLTTQGNRHINLPSVQNPDTIDWELSPHSFAVKPELVLGEGDCQVPHPATAAEREFHLYRVIRQTAEQPIIRDAPVLPIDPLSLPTIDTKRKVQLTFGEVLEFRQSWFPVSHSLGQIVYSLPLAPCESINLAVIEWSRRDTILRRDQVEATEDLLHEQRYDRNIEETVTAALSEKQDGWSLLGGRGGAMSMFIPAGAVPMAIGATDAQGGSIANSTGNRNLSGESLQDIHARTVQATSVVRRLNSTVIVEATQAESNVVQTRTVTNHNHCHALTIQYYEVLRNFKVVTEFERRRPVVLIPYMLIPTFTWEKILRFRTILESVLLDHKLADCFDAIVRIHHYPGLTKPLYRLFKQDSGDHFYTTSVLDRKNAMRSAGYRDEGVACHVFDSPVATATPLHWLVSDENKHNLYTSDEIEKQAAQDKYHYQYKGIAGYVYAIQEPGTTPLYRYFHNGNGDRVYTTSKTEYDAAMQSGQYNDEKIECYVFGVDAASQTQFSPQATQGVSVQREHKGKWTVSNKLENTGVTVPKGTTVQIIAAGEIDFGAGNFTGLGAPILNANGDNYPTPTDYPAPNLKKNSLICQIGSSWYQGGTNATFVANEEGILVLQPNDKDLTDNSRGWEVDVYITSPVANEPNLKGLPSLQPNTLATHNKVEMSLADAKLCEQQLLLHLNANIGYYNRAIWLLQDSVERRLLLEATLANYPGVLNGLDDAPLAVSGNYVAFPYDDGRAATDLKKDDDVKQPKVNVVSLPTRGLFAEAQLGHCNACEVRDVTRFWQWEESPCEPAPKIESITPGPKGQPPVIPQPTALPNPVVQVMQAPTVPDSTGLAAALKVLETANIFRDMSGLDEVSKLLGNLASGAVTSMQEAKELAQLAQNKLKTEQAKAASGNSATQQKQTPRERFDNLQVANKAVQMAANLGMSPDDQQRVFENVLGTRDPTAETLPVSLRSEGVGETYRWADLITFKPPTNLLDDLNKRGLGWQKIQDGLGDVNLDLYIFEINRLPNNPLSGTQFSEEDFANYVRKNFSSILIRYSGLPGPSFEAFEQSDQAKWSSNNPLSAVMKFRIDARPYAESYPAFPVSGLPIPEFGLVMCAEFVADQAVGDWHWKFVTAQGNGVIGKHPVSGTRQFGLRRLNQSLAFYIRAADRVTTYLEYAASPLVFGGAEGYWNGFFANLSSFVNGNGGDATMSYVYSQRHDWNRVHQLLLGNSPISI